jgi:hypothetical protein
MDETGDRMLSIAARIQFLRRLPLTRNRQARIGEMRAELGVLARLRRVKLARLQRETMLQRRADLVKLQRAKLVTRQSERFAKLAAIRKMRQNRAGAESIAKFRFKKKRPTKKELRDLLRLAAKTGRFDEATFMATAQLLLRG